MSSGPKYPLAEVWRRIDEGRYWFPASSRSVNCVMKLYAKLNRPMTTEAAEAFILAGIKTLTLEDFYQRVLQWDCVADIYGVVYDNNPWFIKFMIDPEEDELQEISFHTPKEDFKTVGGIHICKGDPDGQ